MRKLSLITSGVILMLSFLMVGCNTMKKLEREAIETAIVGESFSSAVDCGGWGCEF